MPKQIKSYTINIASDIQAVKTPMGNFVIDSRENRSLNPEDLDDKIHIYERQVEDWFFKACSELCEK